jgi:GT2 family glycosyltransferase
MFIWAGGAPTALVRCPGAVLNYGVFQSNTSTAAGQHNAPGTPDVSVVIVSWNVRDLLVRCLQAVFEQAVEGVPAIEVIVVDNASTDHSAQAASDVGATVIANGENVGYGRANNVGLRAARGRYLLVLNPDTVPCPGSIASMLAFAERNPRAGIVAPRLLNPDGSVQRSAFRFPTLLMAALDLFPAPLWLPGRLRDRLATSRLNGRYPHEPQRRRPFRCDHPLGAAMLISREAYERCGGFDPKIFMYSEEIDLAMRYSEAGYTCWQVPMSEVVHLGGQSTRQMPDSMFIELWRSRLYLYEKHRSLLALLALRALLAAAMICRMASTALGLRRGDSPETERAVLRLALGKADARLC